MFIVLILVALAFFRSRRFPRLFSAFVPATDRAFGARSDKKAFRPRFESGMGSGIPPAKDQLRRVARKIEVVINPLPFKASC